MGIAQKLKVAFVIPEPPPSPELVAFMDRIAESVVQSQMQVPALMILETCKPLNFIGSQALLVLQPVFQTILNYRDYEKLVELLAHRSHVESLMKMIEEKNGKRKDLKHSGH